MLSPQPIHYRETAVVAVIGLLVNTVCAVILGTPALSVQGVARLGIAQYFGDIAGHRTGETQVAASINL